MIYMNRNEAEMAKSRDAGGPDKAYLVGRMSVEGRGVRCMHIS